MEKKTYEKPVLHAEQFTPNEYVAVCWLVSCEYDAANKYEKEHYYRTGPNSQTYYDHGCTHDASHCGTSTNQVIYDDNNDGIADRMVEVGTDGLGDLTCTLYTSEDYETTLGIASVAKGQYIYWTTTSGNRTWHHQGNVLASNDKKPNMS